MSLRRFRSLGIALVLVLSAWLAVAPPAMARAARPAPGKLSLAPSPSSPGLLPSILHYLRFLLLKSGPGMDPNGHH